MSVFNTVTYIAIISSIYLFFAVAFLCEYKSTVVDEVNVVFRCPKIWNKNNRSGTGMFGFTWANKWCDVVRVFNEEHVQCLIRVSYDVCLHYLVPWSIFRIFLNHNTPSLPFPPLHSPRLPLEVGPLNPARGSGERCKLPQRGLGRSLSRILDFGAF